MARVLCEIQDPLSLEAQDAGSGNTQPTVLVGSYLGGRIEGIRTPQAVVIPRSWVREGNSVWVMTDDGKLSVRKLETIYRGKDHLLVSAGVEAGERVVTTDLAAPVDGMELRLAERRKSADTQEREAQSQSTDDQSPNTSAVSPAAP
jgi:hypothetical protein